MNNHSRLLFYSYLTARASIDIREQRMMLVVRIFSNNNGSFVVDNLCRCVDVRWLLATMIALHATLMSTTIVLHASLQSLFDNNWKFNMPAKYNMIIETKLVKFYQNNATKAPWFSLLRFDQTGGMSEYLSERTAVVQRAVNTTDSTVEKTWLQTSLIIPMLDALYYSTDNVTQPQLQFTEFLQEFVVDFINTSTHASVDSSFNAARTEFKREKDYRKFRALYDYDYDKKWLTLAVNKVILQWDAEFNNQLVIKVDNNNNNNQPSIPDMLDHATKLLTLALFYECTSSPSYNAVVNIAKASKAFVFI